jgi:hypothetical protein
MAIKHKLSNAQSLRPSRRLCQASLVQTSPEPEEEGNTSDTDATEPDSPDMEEGIPVKTHYFYKQQ